MFPLYQDVNASPLRKYLLFHSLQTFDIKHITYRTRYLTAHRTKAFECRIHTVLMCSYNNDFGSCTQKTFGNVAAQYAGSACYYGYLSGYAKLFVHDLICFFDCLLQK